MRAHGRTTVLLFVFFQALYALTSSGNAFRVPDEFEVYFQAEHFVDQGDLSVPQALAIRSGSGAPRFFGKIGVDGRPYAPYGPGVAVLAIPYHLLGRAIARAVGVRRAPLPEGIAWMFLVGGVTMLASATAGALAVAGFYRAAIAIDTAPRAALILSLLLGAATVLWPYATSFYSEAWQAATLVWAAALLLEARRQPPATARARVAAAAALLVVAGVTKVTSLVFAPAVVAGTLTDRSQPLRTRAEVAIVLSSAMALAAGVHLTWNAYRFGDPFEFGYNWADWAQTIPQLPARAFLLADIPRGLAVLLLTPGKSLLLWAPPLLMAALRWPACLRREPAVAVGSACAAVVGLLFFSAYLFPEGGFAHGPRNLVPIVPLLLLPAAGDQANFPSRTTIAGCAAIGVAIALLATAVSFLDDQTQGGDLSRGIATVYYERITPPPGRVWNRYRLSYVPFVSTLASPEWLHAGTVGSGPDYFPLHLWQARRRMPGGRAIPRLFIVAWPAMWAALLVAAALKLKPRADLWRPPA